jgi:hypothetical protein
MTDRCTGLTQLRRLVVTYDTAKRNPWTPPTARTPDSQRLTGLG